MNGEAPASNRGGLIGAALLVVLVVLLAGAAWREGQRLRRAGEMASADKGRHSRRLAALNQGLSAAEAAVSAAEARLRSFELIPTGGNEQKIVVGDLARYPEYEALFMKTQQRRLLAGKRKEIAALGLPAGQSAEVGRLYAESVLTYSDADHAAAALGMNPYTSEYGAALAGALAPVADEIRAVIGDDGIGRLSANLRFSSAQSALPRNEGFDLAEAGMPLSADQTVALEKIETDYTPTFPSLPVGDQRSAEIAAMANEPPDPQTGLRPMDQALLDRAAQVLSPQQLQILRQNRIDQARMAMIQRHALEQATAAEEAGKGGSN